MPSRRCTRAGGAVLCLAIAVAASACGGNDEPSGDQRPTGARKPGDTAARAGAKRIEVDIANFLYHPATVKVPVGATVVWRNTDSFHHTVTSTPGQRTAFDSGDLAGGASFQRTFTHPGRIAYFCRIHGPAQSGVIAVGG